MCHGTLLIKNEFECNRLLWFGVSEMSCYIIKFERNCQRSQKTISTNEFFANLLQKMNVRTIENSEYSNRRVTAVSRRYSLTFILVA